MHNVSGNWLKLQASYCLNLQMVNTQKEKIKQVERLHSNLFVAGGLHFVNQ